MHECIPYEYPNKHPAKQQFACDRGETQNFWKAMDNYAQSW